MVPKINDTKFNIKTFNIRYEKKLSPLAKTIIQSLKFKLYYYVVEDLLYLLKSNQKEANQLLQILQRIYNDPYMPEMIASLPIASIDGTLKNKMKATKISRYGHFKTGSLKNVVGIAGFFLNKNKDMNAFIFVMNNNDAKNAQPFIEDLINLSF